MVKYFSGPVECANLFVNCMNIVETRLDAHEDENDDDGRFSDNDVIEPVYHFHKHICICVCIFFIQFYFVDTLNRNKFLRAKCM